MGAVLAVGGMGKLVDHANIFFHPPEVSEQCLLKYGVFACCDVALWGMKWWGPRFVLDG